MKKTQTQTKQPAIAFDSKNEALLMYQEVINQSDDVIEIPQLGTKHSLNISVSVGVILWNSVFK